MLNNEKRAHDLAVAITRWQLDHIKITKEQPVKVNVYAIYRRNYEDILNTLNSDDDFNGITMTKTSVAIDKPQRAHDLSVSLTKWQLDHLNLQNASKEQPIKINVYAIYKKNYNEILSTLNKDTTFDGE